MHLKLRYAKRLATTSGIKNARLQTLGHGAQLAGGPRRSVKKRMHTELT
jgi:hypothetical protein